MRILLISMYFAPDAGANAAIITELAESLAERGHVLTVITAFPHYAENRIADGYRGKLIQRAEYRSMHVFRTYLYLPRSKTNLVGRLISYMSFNFFSVLAGLMSGPQDIILTPSPPLTIGLTAWLLGILKRIPYIYNVQDIYPDIAVRLGVLTNRTAIQIFQALERFVYRYATKVTVLSEGFRANLLNKNVPFEKLCIIPNFVDIEFIRPMPRHNRFSVQHQLDDRFVVLYAGNIGLSQGLEVLLEAARLLEDRPTVRIVIVGNGTAKAKLVADAEQMALKNVLFLPFLPREEVPLIYAAADVSLVIVRQGISLESVPSKTYSIMASARPIIAAIDADSEVWQLIKHANCGLCVEPENADLLAQAIRAMQDNPTRTENMGQNGRQHVVQQYSRTAVAEQYDLLLTNITYRKSAPPN